MTDRVLNEIKGRMMEDIVLLETRLANTKKEVFVLQFAIGEFDMVVFEPDTASCKIYEIKHSDQIVPQQYRHLIDEKNVPTQSTDMEPLPENICCIGESQ